MERSSSSIDEKLKRLARKEASERRRLEIEPCAKERELSVACMDRNGYDKEKCTEFFMNYTTCRKFWTHIQEDRKRKGIQPHLPPLDEREQVKKEYWELTLGKQYKETYDRRAKLAAEAKTKS